jgi:hypothetical protein
MSARPSRGAANRERERIATEAGKAVEEAVQEASETWPQHQDERGWVGDLVGALQRNINRKLRGTGIKVVVTSMRLSQEMGGGADLEIRAVPAEANAKNELTKRIVLQAKRRDKLLEGPPSKIQNERERLASQIVKMRVDAPDASGVVILRPQGPAVYRNPERRNIAVKRLLEGAEPLSEIVTDLIACRWGQVVPSSDLILQEMISRDYIDQGALATERLVITLVTPRDLLRFESARLDRLTISWQANRKRPQKSK